MRERITWDIREGVIGSDSFNPKHAAIITWKNISFAGGIDNALYKVKLIINAMNNIGQKHFFFMVNLFLL